MKNRIYKLSGIIVLIFTLVANLHYAFTDYGLATNNLGSQLMAQDATSDVLDVAGQSTETSIGGPSPQCYNIELYVCEEGGYGVKCTFTGRYGDPTSCHAVGCGILGVINGQKRRCVQG